MSAQSISDLFDYYNSGRIDSLVWSYIQGVEGYKNDDDNGHVLATELVVNIRDCTKDKNWERAARELFQRLCLNVFELKRGVMLSKFLRVLSPQQQKDLLEIIVRNLKLHRESLCESGVI